MKRTTQAIAAVVVPWFRRLASTFFRTAAASTVLALGVSLFLPVVACTIIVKPDPPAVPSPIPVVCSDQTFAPKLHVFFSARLERGTASHAPIYEAFMRETVAGLVASGVAVTRAVLVRQDERPVAQSLLAAYGCDLDDPRVTRPADVLTYHAAFGPALDSEPIACAIEPLILFGQNLDRFVTQYPRDVSEDCGCDSITSGQDGLKPYGPAPDRVLVVHLDDKMRRVGWDEPACEKARQTMQATRDHSWLTYADGPVAAEKTVHWLVYTQEQVSRETFSMNCRSREGFPTGALDHVEPSPKAYYSGLRRDLASSGASVSELDLCAMLIGSERLDFLRDEIVDLAESLGLDVNRDALETALATGELPGDVPSAPEAAPHGEER